MTEKLTFQIPEELLDCLSNIARSELKSVETVVINILSEFVLTNEWGESNFEEAFTL